MHVCICKQTLFTGAPFSSKAKGICPFMSQMTVSMTLFPESYVGKPFFIGESMFFNILDC